MINTLTALLVGITILMFLFAGFLWLLVAISDQRPPRPPHRKD